jgi:GT2 family glycosyltransferase
MERSSISIAIPTLDRGAVLVATLASLIADDEVGEILVVDQSPTHPEEIAARLAAWDEGGVIRWIRLPQPSIPRAMNVALREAAGDIVLFLDDDIVPGEGLVRRHLANYTETDVVAVAGQVIQPWQSPQNVPRPERRPGIWEDLDFPFHGTERADVRNCMAGNLSVRRKAALAVGGFDEHFVGAAYRFETEFCRRLTRRGGRVVFDPLASVHHLKAPEGGVRVYGAGATKSRIEHSAGSYYFAYLEAAGWERVRFMSQVFIRATANRYYLTRPWQLPEHLVCQWRSLRLARALYREKRGDTARGRDLATDPRPTTGAMERLLARARRLDR